MRCFDCGKSFNASTGTPYAQLRKKDEWLKMAAALKEVLFVKDTAARCNSSISTEYRWRHRFLKALKGDVDERLEGTAEAGEPTSSRRTKVFAITFDQPESEAEKTKTWPV
jgi:hypothetical protein